MTLPSILEAWQPRSTPCPRTNVRPHIFKSVRTSCKRPRSKRPSLRWACCVLAVCLGKDDTFSVTYRYNGSWFGNNFFSQNFIWTSDDWRLPFVKNPTMPVYSQSAKSALLLVHSLYLFCKSVDSLVGDAGESFRQSRRKRNFLVIFPAQLSRIWLKCLSANFPWCWSRDLQVKSWGGWGGKIRAIPSTQEVPWLGVLQLHGAMSHWQRHRPRTNTST